MEFLNASSFFISAVPYVLVFGIGFQALWSRSFLVPGIKHSHGGLHVFLEPLSSLAPLAALLSRGDGHGVRRTQSLA